MFGRRTLTTAPPIQFVPPVSEWSNPTNQTVESYTNYVYFYQPHRTTGPREDSLIDWQYCKNVWRVYFWSIAKTAIKMINSTYRETIRSSPINCLYKKKHRAACCKYSPPSYFVSSIDYFLERRTVLPSQRQKTNKKSVEPWHAAGRDVSIIYNHRIQPTLSD